MIIDPDDYRFTFAEMMGAPEGNRNAATNLRNWMARDVISVGQKHKLGRWLFSLTDNVRFRAVTTIIGLTGMPPADANKLADKIVDRYRQLATRDEDGRYVINKVLMRGSKSGRRRMYLFPGDENGPLMFMATLREDGTPVVDSMGNNAKGYEQNINNRLKTLSATTHTMIPVDEVIASAFAKCTMTAYESDGEEWPVLKIGNPAPGDDEYQVHWEAQHSLDGMIAWYEKFGDGRDIEVLQDE